MARNFVICCDGTDNEFGLENTNVVRLIQSIERNPATQRHYYDPGVGTFPEPGVFTKIGRKLYDLWGLAFGTGLTWKAQEAYIYLMRYWEPGDQVYLFGFSRGAYTVRVLAGWLHELGLLGRGNENLVPYSMELFGNVKMGLPGTETYKEYWQLRDEFRRTFARPVYAGDDCRRFPVRFLGVWDTVSSVGYAWNPTHFPFTGCNPSITTIRHAISVDERRCFFRQNLMTPEPPTQDCVQLWFPGVHCDVGGGYPAKDSGLWREPFMWMVEEARNAGLIVDRSRYTAVLNRPPVVSQTPWNDCAHESLTKGWWLAEFYPKMVYNPKTKKRQLRPGLGGHREIVDGQLIHWSALRRIREKPDYVPPNLSDEFRNAVKAMATVPSYLPYSELGILPTPVLESPPSYPPPPPPQVKAETQQPQGDAAKR